jgi:hypothetical protein
LLSSAQILVFAIAHEASQMKIAGTAVALTNMIVMVGGNIFQPVIGKFLDMSWSGAMVDGARIYSPRAFELALSVMPIGIFIALCITYFIRETNCAMKMK